MSEKRPSRHITSRSSNPFARATMLRQTALVRDYGNGVAEAHWLLDCDGCEWKTTATDETVTDLRLTHEKGLAHV